jgi:hypothetical protein
MGGLPIRSAPFQGLIPVDAATGRVDALADPPRSSNNDAGRPPTLPSDGAAHHTAAGPNVASFDDTTTGPHIFAVILNAAVTGITRADPDVDALRRCSRGADCN